MGGVNSLFCFVFLSRKTLSTFKIWEKSFRESVMLAESHPEIPPSLLQPPLAFRPRAPSSSPHSPLRIAPGPTATPALQPGSQASPCHTHPFSLPNRCSTWNPEDFFSIPIKASSFALRAEDPGTIQFLPYPPLTLPHLPSLGVSYPQGSLYKLVPTPGTLFPPFFI